MSTVAKILIGGAVLVLPFAASAQMNDAGYCQALSKAYRNTAVSSAPNTVVPVAMSKCESSDVASAIPVLEQALRNARVNLPPRT
jgi:hypothetical protein